MNEERAEKLPRQDLLRMVTEIASAYVAQNTVTASQIPNIITTVFDTLSGISEGTADGSTNAGKPAVSIRRSVTPDFIVCLEDGRKMKMLKRHLRTAYNLSPDDTGAAGDCRRITRWWRRITPSGVRNSPRRSHSGRKSA